VLSIVKKPNFKFMKTMFCWRCQMDIPMLDEEEFGIVSELLSQGMRFTEEFRQKHGLSMQGSYIKERFTPALRKYHEITGFEETVANAVIHHRISLYGPPCKRCRKPLRSPKAAFCAACGESAL
jgi:hypothetical protein